MRPVIGLAFLLAWSGCGRAHPAGTDDVPPDLPKRPGLYVDINPRWSHDGQQIAFLRATPDRNLQLHIVDKDLGHPLALLEAELVCPDRPYSASLRRYASPDTLAWSPDDRQIAFERVEWFTFENGERLPGTGLWALDTVSGRVTPIALHPARTLDAYYYYHTPQWSPDGRYLAFVGEGINGQRTICVRAMAGQAAKEVTPLFDNYANSDWPTWEPFTKPAAYHKTRFASTRFVETRADRQRAANGAPALVFRRGIRRTYSVPVVETLRRIRPGSADSADCGELWRISAGQYAETLPMPRDPTQAVVPRAGHPIWSPDGQTLAFTLTPDANDFARYELWTVRRDGSGARRVSPADGRGYFAPVWIGNGRLGAFSPKDIHYKDIHYKDIHYKDIHYKDIHYKDIHYKDIRYKDTRYEVVTIDLVRATKRSLGTIDSADGDWSPDRSRIVYALPPTETPPPVSVPLTLRLFETGLSVRVAALERSTK